MPTHLPIESVPIQTFKNVNPCRDEISQHIARVKNLHLALELILDVTCDNFTKQMHTERLCNGYMSFLLVNVARGISVML